MERIKILGALMIIGILTALLVGCSGGGGPSQGDALGVTAQNGNPDPGGSTGPDDKPSAHDDPGRGPGSDVIPGGNDNSGKSGGSGNDPGASASSGNNPGGNSDPGNNPGNSNDQGAGNGSGNNPGTTASNANNSGGNSDPGNNPGNSNDQGAGNSSGNNPGTTASNANNSGGNSDPGNNSGNSNDQGAGNGSGNNPGTTASNANNSGGNSNQGNNPGNSNDQGAGNGSGNNPGTTASSGNNPGGPADHSGGSNDTFDLPVSTAFNSQQLSMVVYEPELDRFLVIWNDLRNRSSFDYYGWAVYGQFVDSAGGFQGQNFAISPQGVEYRSAPIAAYDAATGRSLVVWGTTRGDVLGQMVNPDGTLEGGVIPIAASSDYEIVPALALDPIQGRYLVAWLDSSIGYKIYGQLLGRDGSLEGNPFLISNISSGKLELQAAANTDIGRFLLVWRDYRGVDVFNIYGQMVNSDGTLYGTEIIIADAIGWQIDPALAYDPVNRCFLVTWSDDRRFGGALYEIYGQLIAEDGVLISSNFFISPYGGYPHSVAFEATNPHYLITFPKYGNRIHGQYVAADGTVSDEPFPLSDMESTQGAPHLAYDSKHKKFLTAWTDHRNASADIYGRATLLTAPQDPCDNQAGQVTQGCLSLTDATAQVEVVCPLNGAYANHGEYVSCVAKTVKTLREGSDIRANLALHLVSLAAHSDVGKKP